MNITNNGKKIVNIGELTLLPGDTAPLPAGFEGNPVVGFLIERGTLSADQPFQSNVAQATLSDDAEAAVRAEEAARKAQEEEAARKAQEIEAKTRAIKKMNRAELDSACAEAGIEVEEGDTIPTLQAKLIAKAQEA